jgi:phospholipase A1
MKAGRRIALYLLLLQGALSPAQLLGQDMAELDRCLLERLRAAPGNTTVADLRQECEHALGEAAAAGELAQAPETSVSESVSTLAAEPATEPHTVPRPTPLERRHSSELALRENPFAITAHRPNYFALAAYSAHTNPDPFRQQFNDSGLVQDNVETRFQLSLKTALAEGLFGGRADLLAAYTNRSFWQLYNKGLSAPFRETDHEPEVWISFASDWKYFGWRYANTALGYAHQSNGQGGSLSRSWNRLYAKLIFERGDAAVSLKPWWRIPESEEDDDNPDITDFMGYGEIVGSWRLDRHVFSIMLRNHLESDFSKGTTEVSWSFPLGSYPYFKGYLQLFNGYGESLIDYNRQNTTIGVGFSLTDWL